MRQDSWWTTYVTYLQSRAWRRKRLEYFRAFGKKCQVCGVTDDIELDHLDYSNLGDETITDLLALCKSHHEEITNIRKKLRVKSGEGYRKATEEHFNISLPTVAPEAVIVQLPRGSKIRCPVSGCNNLGPLDGGPCGAKKHQKTERKPTRKQELQQLIKTQKDG